MGARRLGTTSFYWPGVLDEVRVSDVARTADWVVTEYRNQSAPGTFVTLGGQETQSGGPAMTTVMSSPSGLSLTVDSVGCTSPCSFQWTPGTTHTVAAATQAGATGTRYVFGSWSDSGAGSHTVAAPSSSTTYTATFATQYFLTTGASPSAGGTISPAGGWYDSGAVVPVSASVTGGYQFTGFGGSLTGTTTPRNLTITAPATVTANYGNQTLGSCSVFPSNNVWNTPIDTLPVDANSDAYIATIGAAKGLHPDFSSDGFGMPFLSVPGTQPKVPILFNGAASQSDPGPYPVPANAPIEGGASSTDDRHVLVVDNTACVLYEMFSAYPQANGSWTAYSGAVYNLQSNQLRPADWTSADAAGLPILAGLIRYEEVASGAINHAIRMTAPQTRNQYIWPARHQASNLTGAQYPPMGQRFRLKSIFNISAYPADVQVILTAMKKYGLILSDNGSSWFVTGAPDSRWNDTTLHQLTQVLGSNLEAIDESSLMVDPNSGAVK
jgi:hypothetical protein